MNKVAFVLTLMGILFGSLVTASRADEHEAHRSILKVIQTNAEDVQRNAARYQWARVNRDVDRIVADEKKLQTELVSHAALKEQLKAVGRTVSDLRGARLKRNAERTSNTAKKLAGLAAVLLKKETVL